MFPRLTTGAQSVLELFKSSYARTACNLCLFAVGGADSRCGVKPGGLVLSDRSGSTVARERKAAGSISALQKATEKKSKIKVHPVENRRHWRLGCAELLGDGLLSAGECRAESSLVSSASGSNAHSPNSTSCLISSECRAFINLGPRWKGVVRLMYRYTLVISITARLQLLNCTTNTDTDTLQQLLHQARQVPPRLKRGKREQRNT